MKKLLLGLISVAVCAGMLGSIFAYFTDVETSVGNTVTAGTFDLKISDADEGFRDGVTTTWTMTNMKPGDSAVGPLFVNLQNSGNIAGDHVEISFSHVIDEDSNPVETDSNPSSIPGDIARWMQIILMSYDTVNFMSGYVDANYNGFFDLEDVTLPPYAGEGGLLDNLPKPPPASNGTRSFCLSLFFNAGAGNDIQGDILTTTVTFKLEQVASQ